MSSSALISVSLMDKARTLMLVELSTGRTALGYLFFHRSLSLMFFLTVIGSSGGQLGAPLTSSLRILGLWSLSKSWSWRIV